MVEVWDTKNSFHNLGSTQASTLHVLHTLSEYMRLPEEVHTVSGEWQKTRAYVQLFPPVY